MLRSEFHVFIMLVFCQGCLENLDKVVFVSREHAFQLWLSSARHLKFIKIFVFKDYFFLRKVSSVYDFGICFFTVYQRFTEEEHLRFVAFPEYVVDALEVFYSQELSLLAEGDLEVRRLLFGFRIKGSEFLRVCPCTYSYGQVNVKTMNYYSQKLQPYTHILKLHHIIQRIRTIDYRYELPYPSVHQSA